MQLIKLRENTWVNPDKVLYVLYDATRLVSRVYLEGHAEPLVVSLTLDEVVKLFTADSAKT